MSVETLRDVSGGGGCGGVYGGGEVIEGERHVRSGAATILRIRPTQPSPFHISVKDQQTRLDCHSMHWPSTLYYQ